FSRPQFFHLICGARDLSPFISSQSCLLSPVSSVLSPQSCLLSPVSSVLSCHLSPVLYRDLTTTTIIHHHLRPSSATTIILGFALFPSSTLLTSNADNSPLSSSKPYHHHPLWQEIRLFATEPSSHVVLLVIVYRTLYYSSSFASHAFSEALRIGYFELPNLVSGGTLKSPVSKIRSMQMTTKLPAGMEGHRFELLVLISWVALFWGTYNTTQRNYEGLLAFCIADLRRAFTLLVRNHIDTHGLYPRYLNTRRVSYRN
ncbi:hypothetical protein N7527_006679, partial [Penicillium freii]